MRITEAAQRLGTSPRMLRYRESLGLLPAVRARPGRPDAAARPSGQNGSPWHHGASQDRAGPQEHGAPRHRQFGAADLEAVRFGLEIERRRDVSPAALAFGLRVLTDPAVRAEIAEFGRRIGRLAPPPARAIDFEKERALRLLGIPERRVPGPPPR